MGLLISLKSIILYLKVPRKITKIIRFSLLNNILNLLKIVIFSYIFKVAKSPK